MNAMDTTDEDLASKVMHMVRDYVLENGAEKAEESIDEAVNALMFNAAFCLAGATRGRFSEDNLGSAIDVFINMYEHNCGYTSEEAPANIHLN